jgi:hypothetical protein
MRYRTLNWKTVVAGMIILSLATMSYGPSVIAVGHSVTDITLNPPTPNILLNHQDVTVSFNYSTTQPGGVRIFVRPFVGGSLAPHYAASGSSISPTGTGSGTRTFTITSGTVVVDRILIQMWNAGQTTLLFESYLPVSYKFLPS